ncbi:MAG: short-chain dehydrogenase [Myxococcaceae bacterium]|nr:short-chain dehydrogenase [Myxococcaceae bacterium]
MNTAPAIDIAHSTVLITGGASGIGLALATRLHGAGATVVVCGRRRSQLEVAAGHGLRTIEADVADEAGRVALAARVVAEFPQLNVLVNNAGIQQRPPKLTEPQDWSAHAAELAINLAAPMHLTMLLLPHLVTARHPFVVNVTSGLAFAPFASMPTYCATKAALHSFTLSLRHQLAGKVGVIEIVPPAVNTDLGGKGLHDFGVPLDAWADDAFAHLQRGTPEFGYQSSEARRLASRAELDAAFAAMNARG